MHVGWEAPTTCLAKEVTSDLTPLISKHYAFAATLRKKYAAPIGPILPENLPGCQVPRTPAVSNHVSTEILLDDECENNDDIMSMEITLV